MLRHRPYDPAKKLQLFGMVVLRSSFVKATLLWKIQEQQPDGSFAMATDLLAST